MDSMQMQFKKMQNQSHMDVVFFREFLETCHVMCEVIDERDHENYYAESKRLLEHLCSGLRAYCKDEDAPHYSAEKLDQCRGNITQVYTAIQMQLLADINDDFEFSGRMFLCNVQDAANDFATNIQQQIDLYNAYIQAKQGKDINYDPFIDGVNNLGYEMRCHFERHKLYTCSSDQDEPSQGYLPN